MTYDAQSFVVAIADYPIVASSLLATMRGAPHQVNPHFTPLLPFARHGTVWLGVPPRSNGLTCSRSFLRLLTRILLCSHLIHYLRQAHWIYRLSGSKNIRISTIFHAICMV